ncbi:hypothetical protein NEMBOFW57_009151 [Staphylotrichum longicolle]|uniref:Amino acid transporter transmembrane domain-containing protein n=1 Tax=Staphylotrichum longicolle TaxID=669026 RepID=A0AAD4HUH1_9PEZI|nr:hypothetical protein NEMBOFW57_009151 [Staphylotrichum longicolle]
MSDRAVSRDRGQDADAARVIAEHLPSGYTAEFHSAPETRDGHGPAPASAAAGSEAVPLPSEESSLKLQGGDMHRDLFKMDAASRVTMHRRAATFHSPREFQQDEDMPAMPVGDQLAPGGFRRAFLHQRNQRHGNDFIAARMPITRNFVEFLDLYGSFAGEDLVDTDEEAISEGEEEEEEAGERRPLLRPRCKLHYGGGYGEIGRAIAGPKMRALILFSIALSQLGFVCTGIVFVAENLLTFSNAVTNGHSPFTTTTLIALQLLILVPLAWIRNIAKLGPVALLADACILVGVSYIYWFTSTSLAADGIDKTVVLFSPRQYTLTIGAAIFTFEGIGLILPIQSSMAQPEHFEKLLGAVMVIITVVFTSVGALCYATFGERTQIEIIDNFPQESPLVNAVQFLYAVAVLVGTPVQLFPALRIIEGKIFGHMRSGKGSVRTKWVKNAFRFAVVVVCGLVSVAGTGNLDRFVALIGSAACVPLVYVYPAYLHWKGVATKRWVKWGDMLMMVGGIVGMVFTTAVTVANSFM